MDGYNATIMAYGQTGAGKTHTMTGPGTSPNFALRGVIPRAIAQVKSHTLRNDALIVCGFHAEYIVSYPDPPIPHDA